jgi:hypothetical protein
MNNCYFVGRKTVVEISVWTISEYLAGTGDHIDSMNTKSKSLNTSSLVFVLKCSFAVSWFCQITSFLHVILKVAAELLLISYFLFFFLAFGIADLFNLDLRWSASVELQIVKAILEPKKRLVRWTFAGAQNGGEHQLLA